MFTSGWWSSFLNSLLEYFWYIMARVQELVVTLLGTVVSGLIGFLPDGVVGYLSTLGTYVLLVNAWFPLDVAAALGSAYIAARFSILTVRHVWKAIPFTG